jgi:hypothetical protein
MRRTRRSRCVECAVGGILNFSNANGAYWDRPYLVRVLPVTTISNFQWLLVLPGQAIHEEPSDSARVLGRIPAQWSAGQAATTTTHDSGAYADGSRIVPAVIRVVARKGDWTRVILPQHDDAIMLPPDRRGLLVKWARSPVGWARLYTTGPVAGSRVALWSTRSFGIGTIDY